MFNLNEQIIKWRGNLAQSETLGSSDIDELENHLREEIEHLTDLKLSDEEAYWVANHRLGSTDSLAGEFVKINCSGIFRRKLSLMITGILVYLLATHVVTVVLKSCALIAANNGITGYRSLGLIGFGLGIFTLITTFYLCYFICKLILNIPGLKVRIGQLTTRECFLTFLLLILLVTLIYRVAFHVPVPGFKPMNIQQCVEQALAYTTFLWSRYLPLILLMMFLYLNIINLRKKLSDKGY